MNINENRNYVILSNCINNELLDKLKDYPIINNMNYLDLKSKLEFFSSKRIVFNETFYYLKSNEKKEILDLLNKQNIKYIIITSNVEDVLYGEYLIVYDYDKIAVEGLTKEVLKEEKILKKLGFGLPFIVDLSIQLEFYECLDKVYFDVDSLVGELWN